MAAYTNSSCSETGTDGPRLLSFDEGGPTGREGPPHLADLIDVQALQALMEDFHALTEIPMSVVDMRGRVLVGVGWQDICVRFHRANEETRRHCQESDTVLASGVVRGESRLYKCKNNLWDMATPIFLADTQVGNIFTGQFFFEDEVPDRDLFRQQARRHGFDEEKYLSSLDRVPRLSRKTVEHGMAFFVKLADTLSRMGYGHARLVRLLEERDRLAESLGGSEARLKALSDNLPDSAVYSYEIVPGRSGRFLYVSAGITRLNGVSVEDVLRDPATLHGQIVPEYRDRLIEAEARCARELSDFDMEIPMRRSDGEVRWMRVHSRPRRLAHGRVVWDGVQTDVTERKAADELLRRSNAELGQLVAERTAEARTASEKVREERERFLGVLDTLPVMIALMRTDYHVAFANRAYREALGEARGRRCFEYQFGREKPCEECQAFVPLETSRPHHWEWALPTGQIFEIHNFPFVDADGTTMILEMDIDISETRRAREKLREAYETLEGRVAERTAELARSNEDLQQFAYVASHDLREPLRMINGFLQLLEERYGTNLDDTAREYIAHAVEGATRMSRLITDLLEYSRVTSRDRDLRPTETEACLARAVENLAGALRESEGRVRRGSLPTVLGDATLLMQLFQNLVGNAIKFRSAERPCEIEVGAERVGDQWVFHVRDNGIGIPQEFFDRIFIIFQRLHGRREYSGTGIGLAICKKIVERHGGRIWVESEVGKGTTFAFSLKAALRVDGDG